MAAKSVSPPPEAYAILLYADEMPDGGFEPPDADEGVEAGAVGPFVDDAEDRQGVRILNAGGQIALAGHGYDELGACTTMRRAMVPPVAMATCTP